MQSRKTLFGVLLLLACLSVGTLAAPTLTFTFKDVKATSTAKETDTYGLNNKGVIAGDVVDSASIQHAMLLDGKKLTKADRKDCTNSPSSTSIAFYAVNNLGVAAGWCTNLNSVDIGFTWAKGKFTDIKIAGAKAVDAYGINDKGAVVGTYVDAASKQHGFLLEGKKLTKLDPPGVGSGATAWGINNSGVITIWGPNSAGTYLSFTTADKGKHYKAFHGKGEGAFGTAIHQINSKGDVVATVFDASNNRHGVLLHGGKQYLFDDPNGVGSTRADGLNDSLTIDGRYGPAHPIGFEAFTKP